MRGLLVKLTIYGSAMLPLSFAHFLGAVLGYSLFLIPNRHRHIAKTNIALCYPRFTSSEKSQLLQATLIELGKSVFEVGAQWRWSRKKVLNLIKNSHVDDLITTAFDKGNGVIIAMPHLGAWELTGLYLSTKFPTTALYRPPTITSLDSLMRRARERFGLHLVPTDTRGVRALYSALNQNQLVAILPDQDPGNSGNAFAPFFGIDTNTMTLISRLANKTGAAVLFCFAERLKNGKGFHLHVIESSDDIANSDPVIAATSLNAGIEQCISHCPPQFQWCYKRFKNRPGADTEDIYSID